MAGGMFNISLSLGWNERYDHRIAIGIIKYARLRSDIRLFGNDWLLQAPDGHTPRPDGIIARITSRDDHDRLLAHGVPVIDIANAYETDMPKAVNDDALTGRMGASHLLDQGYPHLAYMGVDETEWSVHRLDGVVEALRERDMPTALPRFSVGTAWLHREHNLSGLVRWLKKLPLPCGVMAANDLLGYRITLAAGMGGLRIPDDIGVVGVDNEDVYCELSQPALTSIGCDCEQIGREAAHLLSQLLSNEDPLRRVIVPPLDITVRDSTNLDPGGDKLIRDVRAHIRAHVGRGINVADVAGAFPLSRRALEKRFKAGAGCTLHEEIMNVRLDRARELLLGGRTPAEAAYESGFRTTPHFYHVFRAHFGKTPLEYALEAQAGAGQNDIPGQSQA